MFGQSVSSDALDEYFNSEQDRSAHGLTCAFRKSYPDVMVVQPRQDGTRFASALQHRDVQACGWVKNSCWLDDGSAIAVSPSCRKGYGPTIARAARAAGRGSWRSWARTLPRRWR